jgi:hypothetical protein
MNDLATEGNMKLLKGLIAAAITAALLVIPVGALAKSRDRDHDRMPDKWEKKHHLNVHAKDARKDPDRDHLSNLSEFRHQTDPQQADTDDDGIDDDDELQDRTTRSRTTATTTASTTGTRSRARSSRSRTTC